MCILLTFRTNHTPHPEGNIQFLVAPLNIGPISASLYPAKPQPRRVTLKVRCGFLAAKTRKSLTYASIFVRGSVIYGVGFVGIA